jgi:hypothetical protein
MASPPKVLIKRTQTPNSPPTGLVPGELAIEMAAPTRLWVGVPVALDPTMKKLLVDSSAANPPQDAFTYGRFQLTWKAVLPLTGGTLTGFLTLSGNPTAPLHAVTKQYADGLASGAGTGDMKLSGNQTTTGGYAFTAFPIGNFPAAFTPNPMVGNYQYGSNNAAFTCNAPTQDCAIDIMLTNTATAGAITFVGFTVATGNTGDPYVTTSAFKFVVSIRRIGGTSTYIIKALQ